MAVWKSSRGFDLVDLNKECSLDKSYDLLISHLSNKVFWSLVVYQSCVRSLWKMFCNPKWKDDNSIDVV